MKLISLLATVYKLLKPGSMAADNSCRATDNVSLRVLNPTNRNRHDTFTLRNFPRLSSVEEVKEYLLGNYTVETGVKNTSFTLGYYVVPSLMKYSWLRQCLLRKRGG